MPRPVGCWTQAAAQACGPTFSTMKTGTSSASTSRKSFSPPRAAAIRTCASSRAPFYALPVADASLGGILAWYSLIHTPPAELPAALVEFARAVAPGGSLLIGFFDGPPRQPFARAVTEAYFWSAEALSDLLAPAGFTVSHQERRERASDEVSIRPHGALIATRH